MSEQSATHPAWCTRNHSPDGGHVSEAVIVGPDASGSTHAVLYLWQQPGSSAMVAAELTGDGDDEAMLYLFTLEGTEKLRRAVGDLGRMAGWWDR